jgi:predicted amino acid racemase
VPRLEINLNKIKHNAKTLKKLFAEKGVSITAVIKGVTGSPEVANALVECGIDSIGVSLIGNIKKMKKAGVKADFMLTRLPMLSEAEETIKYADISLNSEIETIKLLSQYALKYKKRHKIVLMVELGDLREGILPSDIDNIVRQIITFFGGIKPTNKNMGELSEIADHIQKKYEIKLSIISAGNSANYEWFVSTNNIGLINNLRIGEAILLGCETLYRKKIPDLYTDVFTLIGEVIELKTKPSIPYGEICQNAFGNRPEFPDKGIMKRAIVGFGEQDVYSRSIIPRIDVDVIGASSDHLILDAKNTDLRIGSEIKFDINYSTLLKLSTSPYVIKTFVTNQYLK